MDKPYLCPDRASLGFAQEFGSGTYIGTTPSNTLSIRNGGLEDLTIESVTFTGAPEFTVSTAFTQPDGGTQTTLPVTIPGNKNFFIRVLFAPKLAKSYEGMVTVKSNADNRPSPDAGCSGSDWCFPVSGCGVPADGGSSPCLRPIP